MEKSFKDIRYTNLSSNLALKKGHIDQLQNKCRFESRKLRKSTVFLKIKIPYFSCTS